MAIPKLETDVQIISKIPNYPGSEGGLTPDAFKAKFDEAPQIIKDFINEILIPKMDETVDVQALLNSILDETLSFANKAAQAKAVGTALEKKLGLSGGTMTGPIDMSGRSILNVATPTTDAGAANKGYVDGYVAEYVSDKRLRKAVDVPASGWTGDVAPYTQGVAIEGLQEGDCPHIGCIYSGDLETKQRQKEACGYICDGTSANNMLTLICFEDKPDIDLALMVEVNR